MADQTTNNYVTDGKIGVDLTATYASTSAGSTSLFPATPNENVSSNNNGRFIFAKAASEIAQFDCVIFSTYENSASSTAPIQQAVPITTTNANALGSGGATIGFAQSSVTSGYYGWIMLNGTPRVSLLIGCQPKAMLYTTSTAGKLDDTTVSGCLIGGLVANTSATSASAVFCMANNAHIQASNG